jgi:hypothetical protein
LLALLAGNGTAMRRFLILSSFMISRPIVPHASIFEMVLAATFARKCRDLMNSNSPEYRSLWKSVGDAALQLNPSIAGLQDLGSALDKLDDVDTDGHSFGTADWSYVLKLWHEHVHSFHELCILLTFAKTRFEMPTMPMLWDLQKQDGLLGRVTTEEFLTNTAAEAATHTVTFFMWLNNIDRDGSCIAESIGRVIPSIVDLPRQPSTEQADAVFDRIRAVTEALEVADGIGAVVKARFRGMLSFIINSDFDLLSPEGLSRWLQSTAFVAMQLPQADHLLPRLHSLRQKQKPDAGPHLDLFGIVLRAFPQLDLAKLLPRLKTFVSLRFSLNHGV